MLKEGFVLSLECIIHEGATFLVPPALVDF